MQMFLLDYISKRSLFKMFQKIENLQFSDQKKGHKTEKSKHKQLLIDSMGQGPLIRRYLKRYSQSLLLNHSL